MRVGIDLLSERSSPGGIHTYVNELLNQFARMREKDGVDLDVVLFAHRDYRFAIDVDRTDGFEVHRLPLRSLPSAARRLAEHALVPRWARRFGVDLVHSINNVLPSRLPCPGVVTVHDLSPFVRPERFGRLKQEYLVRAVPASIQRAAGTICVSESTLTQVLTYVPNVDASKLHVVPQAVSDRFHPRSSLADEERLRQELELPDRFFLHVSLIEPGKNLRAISTALARLTQSGVRPALVVVGRKTKHLRELRALWSSLGIEDSVRYLGEVPAGDVPHLYRMARAFLFPSFYEGFGLPVLEAFASGTPTITSTRSSLPEVAGRAALLVPPDDEEALARAMDKLWRHAELREILRLRGLRRCEKFTWRNTARRTLDVYRDALASRRQKPCSERHETVQATIGRAPAAQKSTSTSTVKR